MDSNSLSTKFAYIAARRPTNPMVRLTAGCILLLVLLLPACAIGACAFFQHHSSAYYAVRAYILGAKYLDEKAVLHQKHTFDCGPTSLAMVLRSHGLFVQQESLVKEAQLDGRGTSMLILQRVAIKHGVPAEAWQLIYEDLKRTPKPVIAFIGNDHFIVVDEATDDAVTVRDPAAGRLRYSKPAFNKIWLGQTLIFPTLSPIAKGEPSSSQ